MSNSFLSWKEVAFPRKWHCDKKSRMSKATKSIFPLIATQILSNNSHEIHIFWVAIMSKRLN